MSPLIYSYLQVYFVCEMMKIIFDHKQKSHTKYEGGGGGGVYVN